MKIGGYEFPWEPDEMTIPRPGKEAKWLRGYGGVGYFGWPPLLKGEKVTLKWRFTSVAQYEAMKALYLAGGVHVLDLSSKILHYETEEDLITEWMEPDASLLYYPDPAYPGTIGGPNYRRFVVSLPLPNPANAWPTGGDPSLYFNTQAFVEGWLSDYWGTLTSTDFSDSDKCLMFVDKYSSDPALPAWRPGFSIYDNAGHQYAIVLPYQDNIRPFWIYPQPLPVDTKVYYEDTWEEVVGGLYPEADGNGPHLDYVDSVDPDIITGNSIESRGTDKVASVITHCGQDDQGFWLKLRPYTEGGCSQMTVYAGECARITTGSGSWLRSVSILPWGPAK